MLTSLTTDIPVGGWMSRLQTKDSKIEPLRGALKENPYAPRLGGANPGQEAKQCRTFLP